MGTTSEKLTYLNNTKQLLKDKINNLGGSIDEQTTFRQYANQLQNVYDNLPKTEYQEGTEVNLGVTSKGKLDFENGVVGIGQSSQDSTKGYQLLNQSTFINGSNNSVTTTINVAEIIANGTAPSGSNAQINVQSLDDYMTLEPGKYTITANNPVASASSTTLIRLMAISGGTISTLSGSGCPLNEVNAKKTFTVTAQTNCILQLRTEGGDALNNFRVKPMLESGETSHTWEKYTGGQASPNPSYPQEIKYVRGRNRLKVDFEAVSVNGIDFSSSEEEITIKGTTTASANTIVGQITLPKGSYTLSCTNMAYAWGTSRIEVSGTGIDILSFFSGTLVRQLTLSQETVLTFRAIVSGVGTSVNYKTKIQVEEGSVAHKWLPYNTIEEVVSGKNLFDDSSHKNKDVPSSAGFYINNAPFNLSGGTYRFGVFVDNQLITTPALMALSFKSGGTTVLEKNAPNQDITITDEQASIIDRVSLYFNGTFVSTYSGKKITGVMITTSEITTYEPYITPTSYQLSLGDIELNAIGNYKDELIYDVDEDKVYKNEKIGKYTFTGEEEWTQSGYTTNDYLCCFCSVGIDIGGATELVTDILSNRFKAGSYTQSLGNLISSSNNPNGFNLCIDKNIASNVTALQTYFANNPTYALYIHKTNKPLIELTDTTLKAQVKALYNAHSLNGTTIITSNGNLPMIIKVRGLKGE